LSIYLKFLKAELGKGLFFTVGETEKRTETERISSVVVGGSVSRFFMAALKLVFLEVG